MVKYLGIFGAIALAACSTADSGAASAQAAPASETPQDASVTYSEAGLRLMDVTIVSGEARHTFITELAASPEEQAKGMMFRTQMGDDEGMLFPSPVPQDRSFWMKNTPLPLDIIFIGEDGRILNIGEGVPYNTTPVISVGPSIAVLEIRGGLSEELGIKPGDRVEFVLPE